MRDSIVQVHFDPNESAGREGQKDLGVKSAIDGLAYTFHA